MQRALKTLTISFPVEITTSDELDVNLDKLSRDLEFDRCEDGRYPFDRELLGLALSNMLKQSLHEVVLNHFFDVYGNEVVITKTPTTESQTSRAYKETVAWLDRQKARINICLEDWNVVLKER